MRKRIIQTILDESDYEEFRKTSRKAGKTIRSAAREAIQKWTDESSGVSIEDPIFRMKPVSYKDPKASEHHDANLYGREL